MSARVQSSPFRETEFDQRLDRMLDDLKSSVTDDEDSRRTPLGIRSTSRSSSRANSMGRRSESGGGVTDAGRVTHHRREYTNPDNSVRTVADTYQYDSGDAYPHGNFQKKVVKSTYSSYNVDGGLSSELKGLKQGPTNREMEAALSQESRNILNAKTYSGGGNPNDKGQDGRNLSNGLLNGGNDEMLMKEEKDGAEVRRIVWRNRYEKTYEVNDRQGNGSVPTVTIEKDAKNRRYNADTTDINQVTNFSSLTRPQVPAPQISPGAQSWADPIPLPTPPQQISPREPGVAYIYNYGSSGGSAVQPLPPLNYVAVAPDGRAPSPTPSGASGQPVIYHYSYHYTIQPGQTLPEGSSGPPPPPIHHYPPTQSPSSHPSALQIAHPPSTGYSHTSKTINEVNRTRTTTIDENLRGREGPEPRYPANDRQPTSTGGPINYSITSNNYTTETHHHPFPTSPGDKLQRPNDNEPTFRRSQSPPPPRDRSDRNISINIHKTTTHTTRTTRDGTEYPDGGTPVTSTPYRGHSRSPDRHVPYPSRTDSLDRVRRSPQPGLPFPDTSPVKPQDGTRIPRKVDDLMSEFPHRNGGPYRPGYNADAEPLLTNIHLRSSNQQQEKETRTEINLPPPERNEINTMNPQKLREEREKTKNLAGPPVYYPPGHEAFSESMHTMTLKEGGRRGKAKWRREAGHKESSSHSESKGGMAMVPVCLPLCCGAACTIM